MSTLGERIRIAREAKGLLQNDLAKMVGVKSSGVISNWEKDLNKPDAEKIVKLCTVLDISVSFLLDYYGKSSFEFDALEEDHIKKYRLLDSRGKDMVDTVLKKETERIEKYGSLDNKGIVTLLEIQSHNPSAKVIPYWEVGVAAGSGIYQLNDTESVPIKLFLTPTTAKADFVVNVKGESMSPDFHNGDKVLVSQRDAVRRGDVGIFIKNGEAYIKELGDMELISRNPEYPNITVSDYDNVVCLGRVIGKLTNDMIAKD